MIQGHVITTRGVIRIGGVDRADFLQGIISNDVRLINDTSAIYAWFLTPQGKYLADFFIHQRGDDWLLECEAALLPDLLKRLGMYRLRSKVTLEDASDAYKVVAIWNGDAPQGFVADPRLSVLGYRGIVENNTSLSFAIGDYDAWRLSHGVPETADFIRERSIMLECNMDLLHGVSWDKGCYMGQELTARTHYRALIKKRLIPLRLSVAADLSFDAPLLLNGKSIGILRSCDKGFALAMLALEHVSEGAVVGFEGTDATAEIFLPQWLKL